LYYRKFADKKYMTLGMDHMDHRRSIGIGKQQINKHSTFDSEELIRYDDVTIS